MKSPFTNDATFCNAMEKSAAPSPFTSPWTMASPFIFSQRNLPAFRGKLGLSHEREFLITCLQAVGIDGRQAILPTQQKTRHRRVFRVVVSG